MKANKKQLLCWGNYRVTWDGAPLRCDRPKGHPGPHGPKGKEEK